jgi:hypothetical protein
MKIAVLFGTLSVITLAACCTASNPCISDISPEQLASLRLALNREFTTAPIIKCLHRRGDPVGWLYVVTTDGPLKADNINGKWEIAFLVTVTG